MDKLYRFRQFTDEYPKHAILEAVFGGPKQYGLKLHRMGATEDEFEYVLKVRGMTLNYDVMVNQGLRYEHFKDNVLKFGKTGEIPIVQILYPNFLRPSLRRGFVVTHPMKKIQKPVISKGVVRPSDLSVLDFGHISH